jgi:hypothetical protein
VDIRAQHTTTTRFLTRPRPDQLPQVMPIVYPARPGDGHLVAQGRTFCGLDATGWKAITGVSWARLGELRCQDCARAVEDLVRAEP